MKHVFGFAILIVALFAFVLNPALAGENGNAYPNGIEGVNCGVVPPPGIYYRMYNYFYSADKLMDADGNELPVDFDLNVYAMANRLIWVSDAEVLGGNPFFSLMLPIVHTDIEIGFPAPPPGAGGPPDIDDSDWGIGDIYVDAANIVWNGKQWQAVGGLGFFAPTGEYDRNEPTSAGKDMWTGMLTLAGTYWPDAERTWSASVLARYETHSQQDERDVKYGDDLHFEWGLGKTITRGIDVGVAGYCQWQVTDDSGDDLTWDPTVHDRVFAAGPELVVTIPPPVLVFISLRTEWEFEAKDRPEGQTTVLTLTKVF